LNSVAPNRAAFYDEIRLGLMTGIVERMAAFSLNLRVMVAAAVISFLTSLASIAAAESPLAPTGLRCDLLAHPEETVITTALPEFGWIYNPTVPGDAQTAYRIIVASDESSALNGMGDIWDSGVVQSSDSINVPYGGTNLQASTDYFWRVQTLGSSGIGHQYRSRAMVCGFRPGCIWLRHGAFARHG